MSLLFRRAIPGDTKGVYATAQALSKTHKEAHGATSLELNASGFLFYPLDADQTKPNYMERIELGDHFWVAVDEDNSRLAAFMMAYTFHRYKSMKQLTDNDRDVIAFFVGHDGSQRALYTENTIYVGQVGTHPDYSLQGIMPRLMNEAFKHVGNSPAAIGEIAQKPLRNEASSKTFERAGFNMPWTRTKDNGARISGTFVRTFPVANTAT